MKPKLSLLLLLATSLLAISCSTVVPAGRERSSPSLSVTGLDSGVIAALPDHKWLVNSTWVARWEALIADGWGRDFKPEIFASSGIAEASEQQTAAVGLPALHLFVVEPRTMLSKALIEFWIGAGKSP
jgi:hypothetical protein